jgi:hypothetical protein
MGKIASHGHMALRLPGEATETVNWKWKHVQWLKSTYVPFFQPTDTTEMIQRTNFSEAGS